MSKPLALPLPRDPSEARVRERLNGWSTSVEWLPQGLHPALDEVRADHVRLSEALAETVASMRSLDNTLRKADAEYITALRDAARDNAKPPKDERSTPEERQAQRNGLMDRLWAVAGALADVCELAIQTIRDHESEIIGALRAKQLPALEKQAEARRLMAEAATEMFSPAQSARWVLQTADDGPMGRGPMPAESLPPANLRPDLMEVQDRAWHQQRNGQAVA